MMTTVFLSTTRRCYLKVATSANVTRNITSRVLPLVAARFSSSTRYDHRRDIASDILTPEYEQPIASKATVSATTSKGEIRHGPNVASDIIYESRVEKKNILTEPEIRINHPSDYVANDLDACIAATEVQEAQDEYDKILELENNDPGYYASDVLPSNAISKVLKSMKGKEDDGVSNTHQDATADSNLNFEDDEQLVVAYEEEMELKQREKRLKQDHHETQMEDLY